MDPSFTDGDIHNRLRRFSSPIIGFNVTGFNVTGFNVTGFNVTGFSINQARILVEILCWLLNHRLNGLNHRDPQFLPDLKQGGIEGLIQSQQIPLAHPKPTSNRFDSVPRLDPVDGRLGGIRIRRFTHLNLIFNRKASFSPQ